MPTVTKRSLSVRSRQANHQSALRSARILYFLFTSHAPVSLDELCRLTELKPRSVKEYIKKINETLVAEDGNEVIAIEHPEKQVWRYSLHIGKSDTLNQGQVLTLTSLFVASQMLNSFEGTNIHQRLKKVLSGGLSKLKTRERAFFDHQAEKFFNIDFNKVDYSKRDQPVITPLMRAVIRQLKIDVNYCNSQSEKAIHTLYPYCLCYYNGHLYLLGSYTKGGHIYHLLVDSIAEVRVTNESFIFPKDFSPADHFGDNFGIYRDGDDKPIQVECSFVDWMYDKIEPRFLHRSRTITKPRNGRFKVGMLVKDCFELREWILSFGPLIRVEKPKNLRETIAVALAEASEQYGS